VRSPIFRGLLVAFAGLLLANCGSYDKFARRVDPVYGVVSSPRVVEDNRPIPKGGGVYRIGKPYVVAGRTYVPEHNPSYRADGLASWYGSDFHGRLTANGEVFDRRAISAAHPTLPLPSYVRVTNLKNHRSLIVRVNDRGPYAHDRIIDVSSRAAELLGFKPYGVARVRVEYVGPAAIEGSDDRKLVATLRHDGRPAPAPPALLVASARPFVPPTEAPLPAATSREIPAPPERPFELGEATRPVASANVRTVRVTRVAAPPASSLTWGLIPTAARPSPPEPDTPGSAAHTGRGLY
jgi:rare lipoprotein A